MNQETKVQAYSLIPEDINPILTQLGISYPENSCPIAWHPEGWDKMEPLFLSLDIPQGKASLEFALDILNSPESYLHKIEWGKSSRFCFVRSQLFISELVDENPRYIVFQPFDRPKKHPGPATDVNTLQGNESP